MANHRTRPTEGFSVLNTQLKILSSRVKIMERQSAKMEQLTQLMTVKNIACMLASEAPNMVAAAAIISADPTLLLQIAGAGSAQALLDALPGTGWAVFNENLSLSDQDNPAYDSASGDEATLQNQLATGQTISMNFSGPGGGGGEPGPGGGGIDGGTF